MSTDRLRKQWREASRRYSAKNRELRAEKSREYRKKNKDLVNKYVRERDALKLGAKFIGSDLEWYNFFMEEIYSLSRLRTETTHIKHEVDHIVPLQSNIVCGLHTPNNLRVITQTENRRKRNSHWEDMP